LGNVDVLVTRDPAARVTYVYSVNRGTSAVTLDYNVSALGLAQDNRVLIHEVSTSWHGGVRFLTRVNNGVIAPPGNSQPARSVWLAVIPEREQAFQYPEGNPVRNVLAVADATLRDGAFRTTPEGTAATLAVRDDATTADGRAIAAVHFDLSTTDLRDLDRVILTLWTASAVNGTAAQAHVYGLAGHTFAEAAATWAATPQLRQNVPAGPRIEHNVISGDASTILLQGQVVANSTTPGEKHLDVTEFVRSQIASGLRFSFFVVQENRWDTAIDGRSPAQIVTGSGDIQGAGLDIVSREGGTSPIPGPRLRIIRRIPEIDLWRRANFGTTADDGPAANLADPDSDGHPNLLEYALGSDPLASSHSFAPAANVRITNIGGRLALIFPRLRAELTYTVEASTDLATWTTIATNPGAPDAEVTVTDTAAPSNSPRRFLRLRVTIP
ncbi:MAG: hypothetical protein MUE42_10955, partial [Opitutaceae bacterium]|nr:hypothetical protein [Opitutaceae bacterium]